MKEKRAPRGIVLSTAGFCNCMHPRVCGDSACGAPLVAPLLRNDVVGTVSVQGNTVTYEVKLENAGQEYLPLGKNPQNAVRWVSLAREEANNL